MLLRKRMRVVGKSMWGSCWYLCRVIRERFLQKVMIEQISEEVKEQAVELPTLLEQCRQKVEQVQQCRGEIHRVCSWTSGSPGMLAKALITDLTHRAQRKVSGVAVCFSHNR